MFCTSHTRERANARTHTSKQKCRNAPTAATCPNICRGVNPNEFSIFVIGDAEVAGGEMPSIFFALVVAGPAIAAAPSLLPLSRSFSLSLSLLRPAPRSVASAKFLV